MRLLFRGFFHVQTAVLCHSDKATTIVYITPTHVQAETLLVRGEERKAKRLLRLSYALNGAAVILGVLSVIVFVFLYMATVSSSRDVHITRR